MPLHPSPGVPQRQVKISTLALGCPTSVTSPYPGWQPHPVPIFIANSYPRALVRRSENIHLDRHTDLGTHWSS